MAARRGFTTFEVGRICGVFHTTVINWVNKGLLKASTTPGGHRRIALEDLVEFMRRFEMPIPADLAGRGKRVLVVEDDAAVSRLIVRTLEGLGGVEIMACASGLEALIAIGRTPPDLIVLDVRIPKVDGLQVCRLLRSSEQTRPIGLIAVSGQALSEDEERELRRLCDAYFRKPISTAELRRRAAALLQVEAPASGSGK